LITFTKGQRKDDVTQEYRSRRAIWRYNRKLWMVV
jgi:hypothetical protein